MNLQKPSGLEAIIFDMDGVLADSEPHWDNIDADTMRPYGVNYQGEHKAQVLGKSFIIALQFYKETYALPPTVEQLLEERQIIAAKYFEQHIGLFANTLATLQALKTMPLKIGLATSSVGLLARPFLTRHELLEYFDETVTGDEIERGKPHPDIYLRAAEKLQVDPSNCLVIEDALSGIQAAAGAGMAVAAIPDERYVDVTLYEDKADYILADIGQVPALVESLLNR